MGGIRTFVDVDAGPDTFAFTNDTCTAATKCGFDHGRDLNGVAVGDAGINDWVRGNTPDGAG